MYAVAPARADEILAPGHDARMHYLAALATNLRNLKRLEPILHAADEAGLRLVPIKGALLAPALYGDPGARPMVDVDLLCSPHDLPLARELLADHGLSPWEHPESRRSRGAVHDVYYGDREIGVELHYRLWHELELDGDPEPLLCRARAVPFGATRALAPSTADHLYVVLVHAAIHGFAGNPLWLTDAALLAASGEESVWSEAEAIARTQRAEIPLLAAIDHLAAAFPSAAPPRRRATGPARFRRAALDRLAPWLQRGEGALGTLPSRVVRPLLMPGMGPLAWWALGKARLAVDEHIQQIVSRRRAARRPGT